MILTRVRLRLGFGLALAVALLPRAVKGASFGVPASPAPPPGYFVLTSADAVDPAVSSALGDVGHFLTLYIEGGTAGMRGDGIRLLRTGSRALWGRRIR